jgi:hypothetical protein
MALVRPGWATAVLPALQGGASPQGGDWYESAVLPAFPRLGWNRDMPGSFRRISRYTGVYGGTGNFYGNYVSSQGSRQSQELARARPPPVRAPGTVSYG